MFGQSHNSAGPLKSSDGSDLPNFVVIVVPVMKRTFAFEDFCDAKREFSIFRIPESGTFVLPSSKLEAAESR